MESQLTALELAIDGYQLGSGTFDDIEAAYFDLKLAFAGFVDPESAADGWVEPARSVALSTLESTELSTDSEAPGDQSLL